MSSSTLLKCPECNGSWADFNGDGLDDFLVRHPGRLYLNVGGRLGDPVDINVQTSVNGVQHIADFNSDGIADFLSYGVPQMLDGYGNYGPEGPSRLWIGDGTGHFNERPMPGGTGSIYAVADYTGDGDVDIFRWDAANQRLTLVRGNGDGTFAVHQEIHWPFHQAYGYLYPADVNGDGRMDVVAPQDGYLNFLFAEPDGEFGPVVTRFSRLQFGILKFADVDGDGKADLIANAGLPDAGITALLGDGTGRFPGAARYVIPNSAPGGSAWSSHVQVGDFIAGGANEIAFGQRQNEQGFVTIIGFVNGQLQELARHDVAVKYPQVESVRLTANQSQLVAWGQSYDRTKPVGERLNYENLLIETEGAAIAATSAPRRRGRAIGRNGFNGGRYHVSLEGDCALHSLRNWTLDREGMFINVENSGAIEKGEAVFLNGEVFMRLHVKDGNATRIIEGTLQVTDLGLSGKLFEWGDNPCGGRWQVHRVVASLSH